jgi:Ca2+-binding EF-hand superfamily protein
MPMGQMGGGGMMGHGMHHGMMMMRPNMLRVLVVMMDTDGDGALSLEEVQAVHARMFKAIDADKNGRVTLEEMQQFFRGQ